MSSLKKTVRRNVALSLLLGLPVGIASCSEGSRELSNVDAPDGIAPAYAHLTPEERVALVEQRFQERIAAQPDNTLRGIVRSSEGNAIAGARVKAGKQEVETNADGMYQITLPLGQYLVTFEHPGYATIQRNVEVWLGDAVSFDGVMVPRQPPKHFDADQGARLEQGPLTLDFEPGDIGYADGTPVHGDVEVSIAVIDPRKENEIEASPAPLEGIDAKGNNVILFSYGMLAVELSKDGRKLQVRPGQTVATSFDIGNGPDEIPMWHHDEERGVWVEEPTAKATVTTQREGKRIAKALLPHFSAWNYDGADYSACASMKIPVSPDTTDDVNLKVISTNEYGIPDGSAYEGQWWMKTKCRYLNKTLYECYFNVPAKWNSSNGGVYFRAEVATNKTGGSYTPLYTQLFGDTACYNYLSSNVVDNWRSAKGVPNGWCGNSKPTQNGYIGTGVDLGDSATMTNVPELKDRVLFRPGEPQVASYANVIGTGSTGDSAFATMSKSARGVYGTTYAANADADIQGDLLTPRDNCTENSSAQTDANNNKIGDACETACRVLPSNPNASYYDYDLDGIDDICDNRWSVWNPSQYLMPAGGLTVTSTAAACVNPPPPPPPPPCGSCFVAGTPITMADGNARPIESISVGDLVLAYDIATSRSVPARVTETFVHQNSADIVLVNGAIRATANHPFYVGGDWVRADQLHVGDALLSLDGMTTIQTGGFANSPVTALEALPMRATTYNIEVEGQHNYFAAGLLVHNKEVCTPQD